MLFKILREELKVDYKLVLAGSKYINGDNKILAEIEKYIKLHNLFNNILMPGYVDKNKALYFYNNYKFSFFLILNKAKCFLHQN